ncbi:retention module-containing protein, partial [Citrobacter sp. wls711]|uniref:retention module-containing protein n=1 Tax=Citrobacter sp. wls711 TaxID=2576425 RepID=UPI0010C99830
MSAIVGTIKTIIGQVFAIAPDGSRRVLVEGDHILAGEQVKTGAAGAVSISLTNGKTLALGRDTHWDSSSLSPDTHPDADHTDIAAIQQAIEDGQDPTQILEATAAGPQPAGQPGSSGGGSHTHVILDLTGEILDPTAGYPTTGIDFPDTDPREELTLLDRDSDSDGDSDSDSDADSDSDSDSD